MNVLAIALATTLTQPQWKQNLEQYAITHLDHPAWGVAHARRNYRLTLELARAAGKEVDEEAIYAAAFLHDIGAIEGFAKPGVEHMQRAVELIDPILKEAGFPMEKAPLVRTIVTNHMYYSDPKGLPAEALFFRDADTLDFLGAIGVVRIFALTGKHSWAPTIEAAEATVREHAEQLPAKLATEAGRAVAVERVRGMRAFLDQLSSQATTR